MQNTKFLEFTQGRIMLKTQLRLGLLAATSVGISGYHTIKDRELLDNSLLKRDSVGERPTQGEPALAPLAQNLVGLPPVANMGLGYQPQMRRPTVCEAVGTIYGSAQRVDVCTVQASVFGLNRAYITTEGVPSPTMIERRLKELNVATEVKEARIGRYFNAIMASGFYDNATSLLVSGLMMYYKALFFEKTTYSTHEVNIGFNKVVEIVSRDELETVKNLRNYIVNEIKAFGCAEMSEHLLSVAIDLIKWLADTRQAMAALTAQNRQFRESDYVYKKTFQVWDMYTYDDGHSQSGLTFGNHFGFRQNRYLREPMLVTTTSMDKRVLMTGSYNIPLNDAAVDAVAQRKGYLNCSGMTNKELLMLNKMLSGNYRCSPFLIDQSLDLEVGAQEIYAYHTEPVVNVANIGYTSADVKILLNKLVANHRYHEDLLCASNYIQNWLVQPSTETVEAHWWTNIHRTLSLPKLGLKRAVFPFLLEGEAVCLTTDSLSKYRKSTAFSETSLCTSLLRNTAWYWGEYLFKINKKNSLELLRSLNYPDDTVLEAFSREPALTSAVLGEKVTVPIYSQTGTYLTYGITQNHLDRVRFGRVNIEHLADYGYEVNENRIVFNNIVAPACAALIVGKGGSLLKDTPYFNTFLLNEPQRARNGFRFDIAYEFYDLWALGVVNRWQGHDVHYLSTGGHNEHRTFAANNVSIAVPPVMPRAHDPTVTYTFQSIRARRNEFGDPIDNSLGIKCKFVWTTSDSYPVGKVDYHAVRCCDYLETQHVVREFKTVITDVQHYQVAVFGQYSIHGSDFQLDFLRSGVTIPSNRPTLDLREEPTGEPPTTLIGEDGSPPLQSGS